MRHTVTQTLTDDAAGKRNAQAQAVEAAVGGVVLGANRRNGTAWEAVRIDAHASASRADAGTAVGPRLCQT